jgi:hypothetical protein
MASVTSMHPYLSWHLSQVRELTTDAAVVEVVAMGPMDGLQCELRGRWFEDARRIGIGGPCWLLIHKDSSKVCDLLSAHQSTLATEDHPVWATGAEAEQLDSLWRKADVGEASRGDAERTQQD